MNWYLIIAIFASPFIIYSFFRLVFGAFFASWYEAKFHYENLLKKEKGV